MFFEESLEYVPEFLLHVIFQQNETIRINVPGWEKPCSSPRLVTKGNKKALNLTKYQ